MSEQIDKGKKFAINFNDVPYDRDSIERVLWGYPELDYMTKGIEVGLTILQADTNMGKSIFVSSVLKSATNQKYKSGVFASEHTPKSYKMLVMQQNGKASINGSASDFISIPFKDKIGNDTSIEDYYVNERVEKEVSQCLGQNTMLFDTNYKDRDVDSILAWLEYCNKSEGTRFFIIDNFMEIENTENDIFRGETNNITKLRNTLLRLNCFCVLVMHINKASVTSGFRLSVKSASGTANSGNKAYNVVALYRKDCIFVSKGQEKILEKFILDCTNCGFDYESCDGFLEVLKTKGNKNGIIGLTYDKETKTYTQANKIKETESEKIYKKNMKNKSLFTDTYNYGKGSKIQHAQICGMTVLDDSDEMPF